MGVTVKNPAALSGDKTTGEIVDEAGSKSGLLWRRIEKRKLPFPLVYEPRAVQHVDSRHTDSLP
jgi:hypothetical protein